MRVSARGTVLSTLVFATACTPTATPSRAPGLAVVGGTVLAGTGAPPLTDAFVVIEGDRIKAVGPQSHVPLPKGVPVVDARGKFVVPYVDPARATSAVQAGLAEGRSAAEALADVWSSGGSALTTGSPADLLILDADPRVDLANLSRIYRIIRGGRVAEAAATP